MQKIGQAPIYMTINLKYLYLRMLIVCEWVCAVRILNKTDFVSGT